MQKLPTYNRILMRAMDPMALLFFIYATTDNLNRTVASVRSIFTKNNGSLGTNGSLSFIFETKGVFTIVRESILDWDSEELELELIDGGADELVFEEDGLIVYTTFEHYGDMQATLQKLDIEAMSTEIQQLPTTTKKT